MEILDFETNETGLNITPQSREYLRETAKWAKFLAILGFIFVGLFILVAIALGVAVNSSRGDFPVGFNPIYFSLLYIILSAVYLFPTLFLYQFANKTKQALLSNNTPLLTEALENQKSFFKFWGIFMIIFLSFYALLILLSIFVFKSLPF